MNLATDVYSMKGQIIEYVNSTSRLTCRDQLTSTQIMKILNLSGYRVQIGYVKALLKELGFVWNGASCSINQLISRLKEYVNP